MSYEDLKILLVEDDTSTRATIRVMLSEMGIHQVFEAKSGAEAQAFVDADAAEIDVVISDWNMPEKTGYEFLQSLRQVKPTLPFIMVTGRADSNSIKDAVDAGVTSYIRKPFSLNDLQKKIMAVYNRFYDGRSLDSKHYGS
jgi:DNA-binding response OmpR family regulator